MIQNFKDGTIKKALVPRLFLLYVDAPYSRFGVEISKNE